MGTLILSFPPPRNWQDFEQLTKDVAKFRLAGEFENYGRQGQSQDGVDVYGHDKDGKICGLQCKHKSHIQGSAKNIVTTVSTKVLDEELALADNFSPRLDKFIIATTSFRDVHLQNHAFDLHEERSKNKLPKIEIWFWELFEEEINKHAELAYFYYENVLTKFDQYDKDKHTLHLLKNALSRPAFNTRFDSENNCDDFIKAIADTQRAFTTGMLYDRDGNLLTSAYPGKNLSNWQDRDDIISIESILQNIRDVTTENMKNGNIIQQGNYLCFTKDWELKTSEILNSERAKILDLMNGLLKRYQIEIIHSNLIRR